LEVAEETGRHGGFITLLNKSIQASYSSHIGAVHKKLTAVKLNVCQTKACCGVGKYCEVKRNRVAMAQIPEW